MILKVARKIFGSKYNMFENDEAWNKWWHDLNLPYLTLGRIIIGVVNTCWVARWPKTCPRDPREGSWSLPRRLNRESTPLRHQSSPIFSSNELHPQPQVCSLLHISAAVEIFEIVESFKQTYEKDPLSFKILQKSSSGEHIWEWIRQAHSSRTIWRE